MPRPHTFIYSKLFVRLMRIECASNANSTRLMPSMMYVKTFAISIIYVKVFTFSLHAKNSIIAVVTSQQTIRRRENGVTTLFFT